MKKQLLWKFRICVLTEPNRIKFDFWPNRIQRACKVQTLSPSVYQLLLPLVIKILVSRNHKELIFFLLILVLDNTGCYESVSREAEFVSGGSWICYWFGSGNQNFKLNMNWPITFSYTLITWQLLVEKSKCNKHSDGHVGIYGYTWPWPWNNEGVCVYEYSFCHS